MTSTKITTLNRWAIVLLREESHSIIVARYRFRSDAIGHAECLRGIQPDNIYVVCFV